MTAALTKPNNLLKRMAHIIKEAKNRNEKSITVYTLPSFYVKVINEFKKAPGVEYFNYKGGFVYLIKDFRIEFKKIEMYV